MDVDAIGDESAAQEWRTLVEQARPFIDRSLEDRSPENAVRRDDFVWTVSVDETTCSVEDSAISGPLRDLAQRTLREGRRG